MIGYLQEQLEAIYQTRCEMKVADFVVDPEMGKRLGSTGRSGEELLVLEQPDGLEVALCLDPVLLERLAPFELNRAANVVDAELDAFCQVTEGVSHFLYLAFAASHERQVSLFELEVQAEIDKFATIVMHGWANDSASWTEDVHRRLFDCVSYRQELSTEERARYEEANRIARDYCARLLPHVRSRRLDKLLGALRHSYRLGADAKMRHLAQAA
jgi:hypothetical protein